MAMTETVGLYLSPHEILERPGYLEALRDEIGLNLVVLSFTGELPDAVARHSPFDGTPPSRERLATIVARHIDGSLSTDRLDLAAGSAGPHFGAQGDERELRAAIDGIHRAGVRVWLLGGAWTANDYHLLMYCPGNEQVNAWFEAAYTHLARSYEVEGLDITHARYPMTSEPRGMFLCACENCARAASRLGYDMARMRADIAAALARLRAVDARRLVAVADRALGPLDWLQLLDLPMGLLEWFRFRADLLGANLCRLRDAVHAAAGRPFIFGADTYPASLSMFVGHNHTHWGDFSDFGSPLLSHADIFPLKTLVAWAAFLQEQVQGLSEAEALQVIYRLVGYDRLALPNDVGSFAFGEPDCEFRNIPLAELVLLDMAKARLYFPPELPSYPIIQGGGAPHLWPRPIIERLVGGARELGHQGVVFQGTSSLLAWPR